MTDMQREITDFFKTHTRSTKQDSQQALEATTIINTRGILINRAYDLGKSKRTSLQTPTKHRRRIHKKGEIVTNEYQESSVPGIFSVGDVQGRVLLTPVAIAAGRRLSNRLFGPPKFKNDKLDYTDIPTVVFSYVP